MLDTGEYITSIKIGENNWKIFRCTGGNHLALCEELKLTFQATRMEDLIEDIGLGITAIKEDLK